MDGANSSSEYALVIDAFPRISALGVRRVPQSRTRRQL